jgi:hypothetical protein
MTDACTRRGTRERAALRGAWRLAAELVASASTSRRRVGDVREAVSV